MHIVINTTHLTKIHNFYAIDNVGLNCISNVFLILIFYTYMLLFIEFSARIYNSRILIIRLLDFIFL